MRPCTQSIKRTDQITPHFLWLLSRMSCCMLTRRLLSNAATWPPGCVLARNGTLVFHSHARPTSSNWMAVQNSATWELSMKTKSREMHIVRKVQVLLNFTSQHFLPTVVTWLWGSVWAKVLAYHETDIVPWWNGCSQQVDQDGVL